MSDAGPLTLRLVVHDRLGRERDVEVMADRAVAAGEVVSRIFEHIDANSGVDRGSSEPHAGDMGGGDASALWAYAPRVGRWIGGSEAIDAAELRQGDRLLLAFQPDPASDAAPDGAATWQLQVSTGKAALRFALVPGSYLVGRLASECDVVVHDEGVSSRHLQVRVATDRVFVVDSGSKNGTVLEGRRLDRDIPVSVGPNHQVHIASTRLAFRRSPSASTRSPTSTPSRSPGFIAFARSPRVIRRDAAVHVQLQAPPIEPGTRRIPILASLAPIAVGVVMWQVTDIYLMLLFSLLAPIVAGATIFEERRSGRKQFKRRAEAFDAAVTRASAQLRQAVHDEEVSRERELPAPTEVLRRARQLAPALWERRPTDADFLRVRVGVAAQPARSSWQMAPSGSPRLRAQAEHRLTKLQVVRAPVPLDLRSGMVVGIAAPAPLGDAVARCLMAQLAVYHSPAELAIAATVPPRFAPAWESLKWLPHIRPIESDGPAAVRLHRFVASDPRGAGIVLQHLASRLALSRARGHLGEHGPQAASSRPVVALLVHPAELDAALVDQVVTAAAASDMAVICLAETRETLPSGVRTLVETEVVPGAWRVTHVETGEVTQGIEIDSLAAHGFRALALALAPLVDSGQHDATAAIPRSVQLVTMAPFADLTADSVARRWT